MACFLLLVPCALLSTTVLCLPLRSGSPRSPPQSLLRSGSQQSPLQSPLRSGSPQSPVQSPPNGLLLCLPCPGILLCLPHLGLPDPPPAHPPPIIFFVFSVCVASGIRSLKGGGGGLCHGTAGVPGLATRCFLLLVPCALLSIVCPLPSC